LQKKQAILDKRLNEHFESVKSANGQPLNDKRNGHATFNQWERQNDAIRNAMREVERTENAIEREKYKIACVNDQSIPQPIADLIADGTLTQWRKYPNRFFVNGVEKARIIWDEKNRILSHSYVNAIPDEAQYARFRDVYNGLRAAITAACPPA